MKKIIAIILAVTCLFALASCGGNKDTVSIDSFKNAVSATTPASVTVKTSLATALIEDPLTGTFNVTFNSDGSASVEYKYTQLNEIGQGDGLTTEYTGTATVSANGDVTGGKVADKVVAAAAVNFNLDTEKFAEFSVSAGVLTAKISKANTASVLGAALDSDATLTLTVSGGKVVAATISYTTSQGEAKIACTYK